MIDNRPLKHTDPNDLDLLWQSNPDGVLLEWSYRIPEIIDYLENPSEFIGFLIRKRFGKTPEIHKHLSSLGSSDPESLPLGKSNFMGTTLRIEGELTEPQALHIYRLHHLYSRKILSLDVFLKGMREAIRNNSSS